MKNSIIKKLSLFSLIGIGILCLLLSLINYAYKESDKWNVTINLILTIIIITFLFLSFICYVLFLIKNIKLKQEYIIYFIIYFLGIVFIVISSILNIYIDCLLGVLIALLSQLQILYKIDISK